MIIRNAQEPDAPAMGRVMVETYLRAHKGQVPDAAWRSRQEELPTLWGEQNPCLLMVKRL